MKQETVDRLDRIMKRDVKQAARYAEQLDLDILEIKAEINELQKQILEKTELLASVSAQSAEAWEYVEFLKNNQNL